MSVQRNDGYATPRAVEQALKQAARNASKLDPSLSVHDRIRLAYFDRFLARVFSEESSSSWVLKGGMGILARVASARSTTDIDLFGKMSTIEEALGELRRAAAKDLGDHFSFEFVGSRSIVGGNHNPYTEGVAAAFDVYIGAQKKGTVNVDLVVDVVVTGKVDAILPSHSLQLPKLGSVRYNVYPVVDQVADKVCASLSTYSGAKSSREKDFVDLMLFATTCELDAGGLRRAVRAEASARGLPLPSSFSLPSDWGAVYEAHAAEIRALREHLDADSARTVLSDLLDPTLGADFTHARWDPRGLRWQEIDRGLR